MDHTHQDLLEACILMERHFGIEKIVEPTGKDVEAQLATLRAFLVKLIRQLLDRDHQRLINALYRIDVSEQKLAALLENTAPAAVAEAIADLVLERELSKVKTRNFYKKQ